MYEPWSCGGVLLPYTSVVFLQQKSSLRSAVQVPGASPPVWISEKTKTTLKATGATIVDTSLVRHSSNYLPKESFVNLKTYTSLLPYHIRGFCLVECLITFN